MSQTEAIARYLTQGRTLTALSALHLFSCFRLAARISDLKRRGFRVKTERVRKGKKIIARYSWSGGMKKAPGVVS